MIRAVLLSVVVLSSVAHAGADDAYASAKEAYQKLKTDQKRRQLRHHWQNVAKKFDAVASKYPRSDRAPEALFNSGELYNELSRFSAKEEDREASIRAYRKLMDGWPKHKLADDAALSLARMLANHEGDVAGARKVIESALKNAGDKKKDLSSLLATLPKEAAKPPRAKEPVRLIDDDGGVALDDDEFAEAPSGKDGDARKSASKSDDDDDARKSPKSGEKNDARKSSEKDGDARKAAAKSGDADDARKSSEKDGDARKSAAKSGDADARKSSEKNDDARKSVSKSGEKEKGRKSASKSGEKDDDRKSASKSGEKDDDRKSASKSGDKDDGRKSAAKSADADSARKSASETADDARKSAKGTKLSDDEDEPKVARKLSPPTDVAEAIRRAIKPLEAVSGAGGEGPLTAQARRTPVGRPSIDEREEPSDDVDEGDEPVVMSLAERLRDVRIGARKPIDESEAKKQLQKLARADAGSEFTLAQQLGLKVRRVIIDAGHGGHDTGAIGAKGTREKDIALAIALKLGAQLQAAGLEVIYTRDDDTFVKLEDRSKFANKQKGDLFISIHCNSAPTKTLRGIETYTLNTSSNRYSIRLAARENATTERGVGDLQYILADLATKANTGESTRLAERVQRSLVRDLTEDYKGVKDLGNKEALFFVLLGARMPAILVETSFLSHPEEEERLADDAYQQKIADSIAESVTGFLEERNKLAQVD